MNNQILIKGIFVILFLVFGIFASALIGSQFIPKSTGMVGPAILIWYILIGLLISLVFSAWMAWKLTAHKIRKFNLALLVINAVFILWLVLRIQKTADSNSEQTPQHPQIQKQWQSMNRHTYHDNYPKKKEMGLGIARAYVKDGGIIILKPMY